MIGLKLGTISGILFTIAGVLLAQSSQEQDPLTKGILVALAGALYIAGALLERQGLVTRKEFEALKEKIRELQGLILKRK